MGRILLYLDTSVWIDFILYSRDKTKYKNNRSKTLKIDLLDANLAEVLISEINLIEISEKLADEKRMERCFEDSLSILEVRKTDLEKKQMSKDDIEMIRDEISDTIMSQSVIVSDKTPSISSRELKYLTEICSQYSIFFIDALHFFLADKMGCNYFVTGDGDLCKKLQKLLKDTISKEGAAIHVIHTKTFVLQEFCKYQNNK